MGLLEEKASDSPDRIAVSLRREPYLTYAQLWELVHRTAALLIACGVGTGDVVALAFPITVEFMIMFLAIMRCRATAAPLDPAYSPEEFESALSNSNVKLLLAPQEGNEPACLAASKLKICYLTAKLHSAYSNITLSLTDIEPDLDSLSKVINVLSDEALFLHLPSVEDPTKGLRLTQLDLNERVYFSILCRYTLPAYAGLVWDLLGSLVAGKAVALPLAREAAGSRPREFSYNLLMMFNDDFRNSRILGEGGSGKVYEGHIYIGGARTQVAVKFIKSNSEQGKKEYKSEVNALKQLSHSNLVKLMGYCEEANKLVLIYEFMSGGTLYDHLFNNNGTVLTWERRYNIAQGLASALYYLHKESEIYVIHRDIKSSNVMLDEELNAKLGDFGLARVVGCAGGPKTTDKIGTFGYAALEYCETGKANEATDVFSFGVVLLEIGSGRTVFDPARDPRDLVEWVWKHYGRRKLLDAVDSRLCQNFDKEQAKALMVVGLWCAHPIASSRPSIVKAKAVLNGKAKLPKLPSKMPQFQYGIEPKVWFGCFGF